MHGPNRLVIPVCEHRVHQKCPADTSVSAMPTKHGDGAQRVSREVSLECIYVCLQLITVVQKLLAFICSSSSYFPKSVCSCVEVLADICHGSVAKMEWHTSPVQYNSGTKQSECTGRPCGSHLTWKSYIYAGRTSRGKAIQNCRPTWIEHK